ncbi:cytochrome P450 [Alkalibacterium olivapovliticus]|uniref:Fatty-acid peroxygenase n=1 Tax=Alkalibacterium olivapovliticus TaxID=99907 RepID=A0A2T0W788_9LACT|nr:cytochrome P450 [Alkalibacterium olivapovliticus]PRY82562.1 fatty-acid peroxygenase [Alkalibacterium olivapovliticus]
MQSTRSFPKEDGLESGLKVLREGYMYAPNRLQAYKSDAFETRLLGEKAIVMGGEEAAKLFYEEDKFKREGAAPEPAKATLLGKGGVQGLDDEAHRHRKKLFMDLMSKERIEVWAKLVEKYLLKATKEWITQDSIVFYEESQKILTQAVCEWAGVPLPDKDVKKRTKQLVSMFESPMAVSTRHIEGRIGRKQAESWNKELIQQVRDGELNPKEDTALYRVAWHRELDGELLDLKTAAVELLNVLRPSVAVAIYFAFTALSLHQFPEIKEKLNGDNPYYLHMFIQEIRRYYPFFPFNGAITRKDFEWNGYSFDKDTLVLLDFYGTNHDSRIWDEPDNFDPERFSDWHTSPTDQVQMKLVAQGGGDYNTGHRCPGEWNTVRAMEIVTDYLINKVSYTVPDQDIGYSMVNVPTTPKSGMIFENIEFTG